MRELTDELKIVKQIHKQKTQEQRELMLQVREQHTQIMQLDDECRRLELLCRVEKGTDTKPLKGQISRLQ